MKNMKELLVALSLIIFTSVSYAGGIGYIDYVKVIDTPIRRNKNFHPFH